MKPIRAVSFFLHLLGAVEFAVLVRRLRVTHQPAARGVGARHEDQVEDGVRHEAFVRDPS